MAEMEFCLLGPMVVRGSGAVVPVPGGKLRAVLAVLLLSQGQAVSLEDLAETLWGPEPPPTARVTIQNHVMRLRRALGAEGARITTQPHGYRIQADAGEIDVSRFETMLSAAQAAARNQAWDSAARQAREALTLWRGEPLADVDSELLAMREVPRLAELRLQALETRISADLHLGRHAEVITELQQLASAYPLREQLHADLMLALYRAGRQAEALSAYQHAREVLVEEIGSEPGTGLREVHRRILAADPALTLEDAAPATGGIAAVPHELPAAVRYFTGRADELAALAGLLDKAPGETPRTVVISAINGTAGVGKTALAVHWAHQASGRFPGGQLYVNLRGYDPGQPVTAADALAGFLRSLGVPGEDIPPETDQRAARYRSLLAGKQMLVVLDNAGSAEQVRPLLPGTGACTVVVTSRDALAGLVARDGANRLDLDLLPLQDAVALLRTLIGARVDAEPEAAGELAEQCCRLPLALRVAAELAVSRPAVSLAALADELADLRTRLDLLAAGGDPRTEVRAVFSWSYRHLDANTGRAFRLLGLHPGPDVEPYAAAALTDTTVLQARRVVAALARAHLIQPAAPGRYGMHDLLRCYAFELSAALETEAEQHAALTRLFDHYLHTAAAAMDTLYPAEGHRRPHSPRPATPVPPLADPATAREWLDGERAALVAAARHTAAVGWPGHTKRLAATLFSYLSNGGHFPEALTICRYALDAARRTCDRAAEATALTLIGNINCGLGRVQRALAGHRRALALFRKAGDRAGEARVLTNIGFDETRLGRCEQAARHQQQAVAIYRDIGDPLGEARALGSLSLSRRRQGRYQEAAVYSQQSLDLSREIGDRLGEAWALARLGAVELQLGSYQHAAGYLQHALALFHEMGHAGSEADCLAGLGEVYIGLGRFEQAAGNFEQALAMSRMIGDQLLEIDALNGLGDFLFQTGDTHKARAHHARALRLASEADDSLRQARAHSGLARAWQADGDSLQVRHHWQEALTRYTAIGAPEADEIRARLTRAGDGGEHDHKPAEEDGGTTPPLPT
jgi:DNA-binding SARP family transcriptional activator